MPAESLYNRPFPFAATIETIKDNWYGWHPDMIHRLFETIAEFAKNRRWHPDDSRELDAAVQIRTAEGEKLPPEFPFIVETIRMHPREWPPDEIHRLLEPALELSKCKRGEMMFEAREREQLRQIKERKRLRS